MSTLTLTIPTDYKGDHVIAADGLSYPVAAGAVVVPQNVAAPLLTAGFVATGVVVTP